MNHFLLKRLCALFLIPMLIAQNNGNRTIRVLNDSELLRVSVSLAQFMHNGIYPDEDLYFISQIGFVPDRDRSLFVNRFKQNLPRGSLTLRKDMILAVLITESHCELATIPGSKNMLQVRLSPGAYHNGKIHTSQTGGYALLESDRGFNLNLPPILDVSDFDHKSSQPMTFLTSVKLRQSQMNCTFRCIDKYQSTLAACQPKGMCTHEGICPCQVRAEDSSELCMDSCS